MTARSDGSAGIVLWMAIFVVIGAPFVYLIWDFINELLSGRFDFTTAGLALVGVAGAVAVLKFVARRAALWDSSSTPSEGDIA